VLAGNKSGNSDEYGWQLLTHGHALWAIGLEKPKAVIQGLMVMIRLEARLFLVQKKGNLALYQIA
jgi:hypothetical protein